MPFRSDSAQCPHSDIKVDLNHVQIEDGNIHYLEVKARCGICGKAMQFRGLPIGVTPAHPTMAVDSSEVTLPFLGEDEELAGNQVGIVGRMVTPP